MTYIRANAAAVLISALLASSSVCRAQGTCGYEDCSQWNIELEYSLVRLSEGSWECTFGRSIAASSEINYTTNCTCAEAHTGCDSYAESPYGCMICDDAGGAGYRARAIAQTNEPTQERLIHLQAFSSYKDMPSGFVPNCECTHITGLGWSRPSAKYRIRYLGSGVGYLEEQFNLPIASVTVGMPRQGISRIGLHGNGTSGPTGIWQGAGGTRLDGVSSNLSGTAYVGSRQLTLSSGVEHVADASVYNFSDESFDANGDGRFNSLDRDVVANSIGSTSNQMLVRFDFNGNGEIDSEDVAVLDAALADHLDSGLFGDWNQDGVVNCLDRGGLMHFGYSLGQSGYIIQLDYNLDGVTDSTDMAHFDACVPTADYDRDGGVTIDDLIAYLDDYESGLPAVDMNCDAGITIDDLLIYLDEFERGC